MSLPEDFWEDDPDPPAPAPPPPPPLVLDQSGIIKPQRAVFPLFEVASVTVIDSAEFKERHFDLLSQNNELREMLTEKEVADHSFTVVDSDATT